MFIKIEFNTLDLIVALGILSYLINKFLKKNVINFVLIVNWASSYIIIGGLGFAILSFYWFVLSTEQQNVPWSLSTWIITLSVNASLSKECLID